MTEKEKEYIAEVFKTADGHYGKFNPGEVKKIAKPEPAPDQFDKAADDAKRTAALFKKKKQDQQTFIDL